MYKNFIYNAEWSFVFAYVPKVACTNWKAVLRRLNGAEDWLDPQLAHDEERNGLTYLEPNPHLTGGGLPEGAARYAMVRDPYERALSAYLNKVEQRLESVENEPFGFWDQVILEIESFRSEVLGDDAFPAMSFEVFLRWLRDSGAWKTQDEHWASQTRLLCVPTVSFDFIGRFENFHEDSAKLLALMDADVSLPSQNEIRFAPTHARARFEAYYTSACCELVEEIYAADFDNFGYKPLADTERASRTRQAELRQSLIANRGTGFVSVAEPFKGETFVRENFVKTKSGNPKSYAKFIANHSQLPALISAIAKHNGEETVKIYDGGAFMGTFSAAAFHAAKIAGVGAEILCIEPNPKLIDSLYANLAVHGVPAGIVQTAISRRIDQQRLSYHPQQMISARLLNAEDAAPADHLVETVEVIALLDLLPLEKTLSLVKLDISGDELAAFRSVIDSPRRLNNVFLVRLRQWQLDKVFDGDATLLEWLADNFTLTIVKNPTVPILDPARKQTPDPSDFTESATYVLAVPKADAQILGALARTEDAA